MVRDKRSKLWPSRRVLWGAAVSIYVQRIRPAPLTIEHPLEYIHQRDCNRVPAPKLLTKNHIYDIHFSRKTAIRCQIKISQCTSTRQEFDGNDAGARPDEAISRGKIKIEATPVKVHADAAIVFPLIDAATLEGATVVDNLGDDVVALSLFEDSDYGPVQAYQTTPPVNMCPPSTAHPSQAQESQAAASYNNHALSNQVESTGFYGHQLPISSSAAPASSCGSVADSDDSTAASATASGPVAEAPLKSGLVTATCLVRTRIPSEYCDETLSLLLYSNDEDDEEHLALVYGYGADKNIWSNSLEKAIPGETEKDRRTRGATVPLPNTDAVVDANGEQTPPLARIHSCCFTGETIGSNRCDCREQLVEAMKRMSDESRGVILYLKQEGRGIGLKEKMRAYNLIDQGFDTHTANIELGHPADARTYKIATAILRDLQIPTVRLLTNNPHKVESVVHDGVVVSERVPMIPASWSSTDRAVLDRDEYLVTKVQKMGHILDIPNQFLNSGAVTPNSAA
ncbi:GTP cyclohydrolase II [Chytriomyces hyalinus]|nr:GTP cyclohydrolase II [Chytriomyces hyalinus]